MKSVLPLLLVTFNLSGLSMVPPVFGDFTATSASYQIRALT